MQLTISTADEPLELPDDQVRALARFAERHARLVGVTLREMRLRDSGPWHLPAAFLFELAAVLQLRLWELQEVRQHLPVQLPTFKQAAAELARRAEKGLAEFDRPDGSPLATRLLQVWLQHFAWQAGADVVLGNLDEEAVADALADFLWRHRRELVGALQNEGKTE